MLPENFISQLMSGDLAQAKDALSDILSAKAFEALDARKQDIAQTLYVKEETENLLEAKKLISKHGSEGDVHTAKVYRDPEYNEYQVHYFKNGKHMGEGPVGYHDDKADAQASAEHSLKMMNKKVNEEAEQLDELSNDTIENYKKRAYRDLAGRLTFAPKPAKEENKIRKRTEALKKLDPEKKSVQEEAEQLDELSRGTLTSYNRKAESDLSAREKKVDPSIYIKQRKLTKAEKENDRKMDNRVRGMMRADDKISKKDADYEKAKEKDETEMDKKYGPHYRPSWMGRK